MSYLFSTVNVGGVRYKMKFHDMKPSSKSCHVGLILQYQTFNFELSLKFNLDAALKL